MIIISNPAKAELKDPTMRASLKEGEEGPGGVEGRACGRWSGL